MKKIITGLTLLTLAIGSVKAESWESMLRRWDLENARIVEQQAFDDAEYGRRAAKRAAEDAQMAAQIAEGDAEFGRWQAEQAAEKQQETLDEINDKLNRMERDGE
jgi:hypothetical protein